MYEKIRNWFKRNWPHILSFGLTFIIGVIVGRGRRNGTAADIEQLRADNDRLRGQISNLRSISNGLRKLDDERKEELEQLEVKLAEADRAAKLFREELEHGAGDTADLSETNKRLREFVQRYGEELRKIEGDK